MTVIFGIFTGLLALLALVSACVAGAIVLSFNIAWLERVNRDPATIAQRRPALAARLLLAELASLLLTLLLRPCGWLPPRMPTGPSRQPPVILLHGLCQNRSCLLPLARRLRAAGCDCVVSINTPPWLELEVLTDRLRQAVAAVCAATGARQVRLVGHSMGGLIACNYLQLPGEASRVANCVTIGSPHRGSMLAPLAVSRLGRTLHPGSELLTRLNAAPLPAGVRFTAIYSQHDNIIVPAENARLDGAENVELTGLGHTAMLFSPRLARAVVEALNAVRGEK